MATRLHSILSRKAALGMGYGEGEGEGELEDVMQLYGRGVRAGRGPSKASKRAAAANPWIQFIRAYADFHDISYKDALKSKAACKEYRQLGRMTVKEMPCMRKSGSKTAKKRIIKKRVVKRRLPVALQGSKRTCPKGKKPIKTKAYTRKTGKHVKSFYRCVK